MTFALCLLTFVSVFSGVVLMGERWIEQAPDAQKENADG